MTPFPCSQVLVVGKLVHLCSLAMKNVKLRDISLKFGARPPKTDSLGMADGP